jgi:lycopene beta-cyclase
VTAGLILVGGGLANGLIAMRLLADDPEFPVAVLERDPRLGGDHTWSFHDTDLTREQRRWIDPIVVHSWDRHELRFPNRRRVMTGRYNSVTSSRLHEVVGGALGDRLLVRAEAVEIAPDRVVLADGGELRGPVIDGRGDPGGRHLEVAFQKFLGLFVRLAGPHELDGPILMDATVDQSDGYRFVYTLPFSPTDLLVEDTYYTDGPELDLDQLRAGILDYAAMQGWSVEQVIDEEVGVLPIVLGGDLDAFWDRGAAGVARSGMRGAFFHPTTGYSLPEAAGLADAIAALDSFDSGSLFELTRRRSAELWRATGYFRLLNRMLFRAAEPDGRWRIFERFYGLSDGLIQRFYAGRLQWTDKARVLIGKPPVPIHRAIHCLVDRRGPVNEHTTTSGGEP